jgi:hypothetical protein
MRTTTRYFIPLSASTALLVAPVAAALFLAPLAAADPGDEVSTDPAPACTSVAGDEYTGTSTTECQSPGNVQIDATAPAPQYPFDDGLFYGPGIFLGGTNLGPHGGGGGGGGHR